MKCIRNGVYAVAMTMLFSVAQGQHSMALDIDSQPLVDALNRFADQTGLQVLVNTDEVRASELMAPRVSGMLTPDDALRQLLQGSELQYEFINERTVRVSRVKAAGEVRTSSDGIIGDGKRLAQTDTGEKVDTDGSRSTEAAPSEVSADKESMDSATKLEEIVVTAQKRQERLSEVPISISVLGGDRLDANTDDTLNDAISRVPGVYSFDNGQGGGTKFAVRGVTSNVGLFEGSSTVGYYLDEVAFGFARFPVLPDANAYDLERVEVLRGPQGTLYGANALNGVIRILSKDANLDEFEAKARATVSSTEDGGENYRTDMAFNAPLIPGKLAVRTVLGYSDLDGWIDQPLSGKTDVNDAEIKTLRLKVNAKPSESTGVELMGWFSRDDRGGPSISAGNSVAVSLFDEPIATDYDIYGLTLTHDFSFASLVSATNYMDYANVGLLDIANVDRLNTTIQAKLFSQEIRLNSNQAGPWQWSLGAMYRDTDDRIFVDLPVIFPGAPGDTFYGSQSYALFGELKRSFGGGLFDLTGGLRYFEDRSTGTEVSTLGVGTVPSPTTARETFSAVTPRVVLTWHPSDDLNLYGSYSEGFRSGFAIGVITGVGIPAPPVGEDTLTNYEIGVKGAMLDRRLSYEAAVYYIDWRDTQQALFQPFGPAFIAIPLNGEDVSGTGFDVALNFALTEALNLGLSAGWNDLGFDAAVNAFDAGGNPITLFQKGDRPDESPETSLRGEMDYTTRAGESGLRMRFSAAANYSSRTTSHSNGSELVAFGDDFFNGQLEMALLSPNNNWTAMLYADNIANEDPVIRPSAATATFNSRVRPRTIGVQFEVRF